MTSSGGRLDGFQYQIADTTFALGRGHHGEGVRFLNAMLKAFDISYDMPVLISRTQVPKATHVLTFTIPGRLTDSRGAERAAHTCS